jgi:hypothetical protein
MDTKQIEIDTGHTVLNITHVDNARTNGPIFTVYVNLMSVRSGSLHMPRILDAFIKASVAACDFPEGMDCSANIIDVCTQIEFYVKEVLSA